MSEHKITKEDVINYLKTLPKGEKLPTLRMIQAELGGGSLATVSAGVRAFVEEAHAPAETATMPAEFGKIANAALVQLWAAAVEDHKIKLADSISSLQIQLTAVMNNCIHLELENKRLERESETVKDAHRATAEKLKATNEEIARRMMEADRAKEALTAEQTAHAATKQRAAESEGKTAVLAERVKELEAALSAERTARADAEQKKAAAEAALTAFREAVGG